MKIHHVGIAVESLSKAIPIFEKIFGRPPDSQETVDDQKVRVAVFNLTGGRIELLEAISKESPVGRFIAKRGQGIHHLTLTVPDLARRLGELAECGICLVNHEPRTGAGGEKIAFLHPASAAGVLIELIEERKE